MSVPFSPQPKNPVTARQAREQRRRDRERLDIRENVKVHVRSRGRCEMPGCAKRAAHIHHVLSGSGVRARGKSALAVFKVHLCMGCHEKVHAQNLKLTWTEKELYAV